MFADRAAEAYERLQAAARESVQQSVDQLLDGGDAQAGSGDPADHLLHRPRARDLAAGGMEGGERRGLLLGEIGGVLQ